MRDDLLDAQESINWAIAQIKILNYRISEWIQSRPYVAVTEPDSDPCYEIIKVRQRGAPMPLIINAETGAIINMIRSGLDILAVALAERNGFVSPKDVYFPIADSVLSFIDPKNGAIKKIARLSDRDRKRIEQLKPYQGGDDLLYSLHQLDIMRKHRKLVGLTISPRPMHIYWPGADSSAPEALFTGTLEDGAPLWRVARRAQAEAQLRFDVSSTEIPFVNGYPVRSALPTFAERAIEIIKMFDC